MLADCAESLGSYVGLVPSFDLILLLIELKRVLSFPFPLAAELSDNLSIDSFSPGLVFVSLLA